MFEGSAARVRYAQGAYCSMRMQGRLCVKRTAMGRQALSFVSLTKKLHRYYTSAVQAMIVNRVAVAIPASYATKDFVKQASMTH